MTLAELSLRRPVTAVMFFVSMVVIGLIASFRLPLEKFPEVNVPFIFVNFPYPGSTPQEVERSITRPAEEALSTLPGIKSMNSTSRADGAGVQIQFTDWDRDINITSSEARDRIDAIRGDLPDDMQRYRVGNFSPSDQPMLRIRFSSDRDLRREYELLEREVQKQIERIPGVARVEEDHSVQRVNNGKLFFDGVGREEAPAGVAHLVEMGRHFRDRRVPQHNLRRSWRDVLRRDRIPQFSHPRQRRAIGAQPFDRRGIAANHVRHQRRTPRNG